MELSFSPGRLRLRSLISLISPIPPLISILTLKAGIRCYAMAVTLSDRIKIMSVQSQYRAKALRVMPEQTFQSTPVHGVYIRILIHLGTLENEFGRMIVINHTMRSEMKRALIKTTVLWK